jgi:hypothetical protein
MLLPQLGEVGRATRGGKNCGKEVSQSVRHVNGRSFPQATVTGTSYGIVRLPVSRGHACQWSTQHQGDTCMKPPGYLVSTHESTERCIAHICHSASLHSRTRSLHASQKVEHTPWHCPLRPSQSEGRCSCANRTRGPGACVKRSTLDRLCSDVCHGVVRQDAVADKCKIQRKDMGKVYNGPRAKNQ